jgi:hypothetical protein
VGLARLFETQMFAGMSVEIYRWDALQSDGKSDGKNLPLSSRERFAVRPISGLTVNSERKIQHQCGSPGDRRVDLD